jgi:hypothetical protein
MKHMIVKSKMFPLIIAVIILYLFAISECKSQGSVKLGACVLSRYDVLGGTLAFSYNFLEQKHLQLGVEPAFGSYLTSRDIKVNEFSVLFQSKFPIGKENVIPYGCAGGNFVFSTDTFDNSTQTRFYLAMGGGLAVRIKEEIGVYAEARYNKGKQTHMYYALGIIVIF